MNTAAWCAVTDLLLFAPTDPEECLMWMRDLLEEYVERCEELSESNEELASEKDEALHDLEIDDDQPEEAIVLYQRAIALHPECAIAITNLGNLRYRAGDDDGAISLYTKALEIDPDQPEALYNLGYVRLEQNRPAEAVPLLRRAIELDDRFEDAHYNLAFAYQMMGNPVLGVPHMRRYLELATDAKNAANAKRFIASNSKKLKRLK
jgi:tetratricopeptide (TPR) repeat protein